MTKFSHSAGIAASHGSSTRHHLLPLPLGRLITSCPFTHDGSSDAVDDLEQRGGW